MAIRTKQPQEYNSQLKKSSIIYFELDPYDWGACRINTNNGEVDGYRFTMEQYFFDENNSKVILDRFPILYRATTYEASFGTIGIGEIKNNFDDLMLIEIPRVNQIPYSPNRIQNIRYWDLTDTDLEIVV